MRLIRQILYVIIIGAVAAGVFFYHKNPCDTPLTYRIGSIDSGFNISDKSFKTDVDKAALIWNQSVDKPLLKYDPEGELVVNLKYDNRQKTQDLRSQAVQNAEVAQAIKDQFTTLSAEYDRLKTKYESDLRNRNVSRAAAEDERIQLNALADQINAIIDKYNLLVGHINATVRVVNQNTGEFEEGVYEGQTESITIYEYDSELALIRVLAHEFGHALGLGHNQNPASIMYKLNEGKTLKLSAEDLSAIKTLCKTSI